MVKKRQIGGADGAGAIHFTLRELVFHFDIPEVPDIAATDSARCSACVEQLHQLQQLKTHNKP